MNDTLLPIEVDEMEPGVAIIGMAGRFPGAPDLESFWRVLVEGQDTITRFGPGELKASNTAALEGGPDYVAARGVLEDVAMFDSDYFGVAPREADRMDPQHRIFLEACSNALEDAGYVSESYAGEIGLFAGCSLNTYLLANLATGRGFLDELTGSYQVGEFQVALGNDKDFLTTRAAYKLNLRGPVVSVQSACATSLVAIAQACQSLMSYGCEMALAGGASATFPQERGHVFQEGGIGSRDGHCRPFDAAATGTVFGHGVGVVVLKRLEDAIRDGDQVRAVIRGFAVNNDGSAKAGYMAPGIDGQTRVIAAAQAMAGFAPETISYIEAHGTATPLGDPIEVAALTRAFRQGGATGDGFCTIGTAKGNIGHLDSAAGVAGTIKTVLSLEKKTLPGLAHFVEPNPNIELAGSPFYLSGKTRPWVSDGPLRAGVSAFGVGGVNAHVVIEEAPAQRSGASPRSEQVLCVSGRSEEAARTAAANLVAFFASHPETSLADAAYTLAVGRRAHGFRVAVAAKDLQDAQAKLAAGRVDTAKARRMVFQFSGQGTQFVGMGQALYQAEPVYRAVIDACAAEAQGELGCDLRAVIAGEWPGLEQTRLAQPAIFATELALATLWQSWGVRPEAMVGHSLGEYVAATLAGVWTREQAIGLVCLRARLMQAMEPGAMLSVALGERELAPYLGDAVSLAALNAPRASVLAGTFQAIEAIEQRLASEGVATRRLKTSHAFHSAMMEPMLAEFEAAVGRLRLHPPTLPLVSSVTGTWLTAEEAMSPAYWARQCRLPVRFQDALATLESYDLLLEVGVGDTLTKLAMQQGRRVLAVSSLTAGRGQTAARTVADALAELWSAGIAIDFDRYFSGERRLRTSLPTYPFTRRLHWIEPPAPAEQLEALNSERTETAPMTSSLPLSPVPVPAAPVESRDLRLRSRIAEVFAELSGIETRPEEAEYQFLELGFDSLFLTQATQALSKAFGVKLTFRQLMEQCSTIASLAAHLDGVLPADAFAAAPVAAAAAGAVMAAPGAVPALPALSLPAAGGDALERLFAAQTAAMAQMFAAQVSMLTGNAPAAVAASTPAPAPSPAPTAKAPALTLVVAPPAEAKAGAWRPIQAKAQTEVNAEQERYIKALIERYEAKTPGSKRLTAQGRGVLADPRAVSGFRPQWKEMVYPLLVERARGSKLWDVDGNEYVDIVNGYGCIMFGHSPDFVVAAAQEQLERGVAIGPQTPLAAEVAGLIQELTGNERVTFCNTGSEAVMAGIRVARTVTGRDKLVYFSGDYHGTFDEVLVRSTPRGSAPVAPGIPLENTKNVVVLEYGVQASLDYIQTHAEEIAAVLVEPVQTRHPELQPMDFIREVRRITAETGSAFILDEVVTGFRLAPGGVQEMLGIRADMCTYGKVIGGGHPIGVLSGKAMYLDALDGGAWQYGDDSGPEVGVTFFAGTFVRHPLAMAAARAVLNHLKAAGPALQADLNAKTKKIAESLDAFFVANGVPSRIHHFASWFYFTFPGDARLGSLLYYSLRAKGLHIQEGYPCFLTTAHTAEDLAFIERVFKEAVLEMQAAKVLPRDLPPVPGMDERALAETAKQVPLTEPQREVFLAAALNDEANCAFNESLTLELHGALREEALEAALAQVFARHDALRSTVSEDGESLVIADQAMAVTVFRDLRALSASEQELLLADVLEQEAGAAFDLTHGPLVRAICFRMSDARAVLVLTAHHIVLDGWSANQLLEEVGKVYGKGAQAELGPLLPFSSYAVLERGREQAGEFAANEAYWVKQFAGRSPRLELPTDRPRTQDKSYRGRTFTGRLGAEVYTALKQASAKAGCTLYVTLLSGFELLMHRLTGQDEVVVGISTAGQALYDGASLVGHCVHFLPMLSTLGEATTAREHLQQTKGALLDAYDHQEFTYGSLLRRLKLEREPGRLPLIEVQFNLERVGANVVFDGLTVEMKANAKRFVNTDLFLNVMETANDLEFALDFNTDLFDETTVARWLAGWAELLRSQASELDLRVDELKMLTAGETEELVSRWNQTERSLGEFETVATTFLARAKADPTGVALECGDVRWSNAELAEYATSVAKRLVAEGLRPGGLVGIAVERSHEMVGAMLAVMLAGGAYVPLDPGHPAERIEQVLTDSGIGLLLSGARLKVKTSAKVISVFDVFTTQAELPAQVVASDLAYVIYTSGSTGVPKGVAIEHGALVNLLRSMAAEPGLCTSDVLVAVTTLAFDIAALELLLPLVTGAKLVIATSEQVQDGPLLLDLMERTGATVLQATPGAWRILIDAGWTGERPLKALCGGEALPRELAERMLDRTAELWNVYGPTETTIWSSATRVTRGTGALRLGMPIANTQFYVLDPRRQLVPLGVTGELYIGGEGLARGYWKRPELTAEKFIQTEFGGRIYATGDLARRLGDGSIELLGRADFQVKIRGYRIELAEIEAALSRDEQVREAVVVAAKAASGVSRLVAFVATGWAAEDARSAELIATLRELLLRTLPEYMVPSAIVVLGELPRTPNGKIDRKALPAPDQTLAQAGPARTSVPPSTPAEVLLAGIWAEVLEISEVSVTDSIFDLGADSLLIFRIAARAQREGLPVNATLIFQRRTIAGICAAVEEQKAAPQMRVKTRIAAASREAYRLSKVNA